MTTSMSITTDQLYDVFFLQSTVPRWLLRSRFQQRWVCQARAALALVMHEGLGMSWPEIGEEFGRDHTSPMRLVEKHRQDEDVVEMVDGLCKTLGLQLKGEAC